MPAPGLLPLLAIFGLSLLAFNRWRWAGAAVLAFCWTLWQFQHRLEDRLQAVLAGGVVRVEGVITSIPQHSGDRVSFRFEPHATADPGDEAQPRLPHSLLVTWYRGSGDTTYMDWKPPAAGQRWEFELLLKPPWSAVNFAGPDHERWLFAAGIGGLGTVRSGNLLDPPPQSDPALARLRQRVFDEIARQVEVPRSRAVLQALAVAERSGLDPAVRDMLAATGTSHLLAISGLHVGMAALAGGVATRSLAWALPLLLPARGLTLLGLAGGALCAVGYTALADFGVPTLRSLVMLLVVLLAIFATRRIHPARAWLLALSAVLLADPFAPLGAGFWFSFTAVAALLWVFAPRPGPRRAVPALLLAQAAVMLALLPVAATWYQAASWIGLAANLLAIPLVSLVLVPLVLAAMAAMGLSSLLAGLAWNAASIVTAALLAVLEWLAGLPGALVSLAELSLPGAALALLGAAVLLAPRGWPGRWIGCFLLLPLFLRPAPRAAADPLLLDVLDVGQGTAALLQTGGRSLLYDSGPGDGISRDRVDSVILPALRASGAQAPDRILISHGDLDHAGGLGTIRRRFPRSERFVNLRHPATGEAGCTRPLQWHWLDTGFQVLHPSPALPYLGNDSSCVLSVERGRDRLLLAGDISAAIEARLLRENLAAVDLLLVPHHGSTTSSSPGFVEALRPRLSVATASLGNRFGFPKPAVRERYESAGSRFLATGECGGLRFELWPDGTLRASSARLARPAPWRWPAAAGCPAEEVFSVSFAHPDNTLQSTE